MSTSTRKAAIRTKRKPLAAVRAYVPTTALAKRLDFDDDMMHVRFADGRVLSVPLNWFPTLQRATPKELARYEIGGGGVSLHWPDLDEDLSVAGLMAGVDWRST
jgi:Protein of unknown function (DUF2442)